MTHTLRYYTLDAENRPVETDGDAWWEFFSGGSRLVARTVIDEHCSISTVFVGIDLSPEAFCGGPQRLFETMIFGGRLDRSSWLHASWDDAVVGHEVAVKKAREVANDRH